jgi:hypothetical protein
MHRAQQLHRAALVLRHAVEASLDFQRFEGREERIEQDFLIDDADRNLRVARMPVDVEAPDRGAAASLVDQPGEDIDERRLARAVGTEQAENRPARDGEGYVGQGGGI